MNNSTLKKSTTTNNLEIKVSDLSRRLMALKRMKKANYDLGARQRTSKENDLQLKF